VAIGLSLALPVSCGRKAAQVTEAGNGTEENTTSPARLAEDNSYTDLTKYVASLLPVTGQTVEPIRFGEKQPDGTYIRDGRRMTLGEILASAPKVPCPPLTQIRLGGNNCESSASDKSTSGKTTSGIGDLVNPPQIGPVIPGPINWNPPPNLGNPGPISPPIFGGPLPPGPFHYEGEGVGPLYDPTPIVYNVMDGPPVDVGIVKMGPFSSYPALAVLTRHTIQLFAGPYPSLPGATWTARLTINLPTQVTTWDPNPANRHTVDGAYAVRLRVADLSGDQRDDMVVVMNWDDPAWPQGANQFGYTGTWVYYQKYWGLFSTGTFDEPFSPGGASREYDIAAFRWINAWSRASNFLPGLIGVQNPHIGSGVNAPGSDKLYPWDEYTNEYYDHRKFKDAGPALEPQPEYIFFNANLGITLCSSCVESAVANNDDLDDLVHLEHCVYSSLVFNAFQVWCQVAGSSFHPYSYPTAAEPFRARPGRFEPNKTVDDYALTFPDADSLQMVHAGPPRPYPDNGRWWYFYTPRIILRNAAGIEALRRPGEIVVSDLNGDGLSDLTVLSDNRLYVLLNLGNRTLIISDEFPVQDDVQRAAVGPLFGGLEKDIAVIDSPSSCVLVYRPISK
jgi:hypothetical protein